MTYRILFAPDGKHWIDHKDNNRKDPSEAVREARAHVLLNPFGKAKVINTQTKFVIYKTEGKRA